MRRFLPISFVALALVVGAAPAAHAQDFGYFPAVVDSTTDVAARAITDSAAAKTVVEPKTTTDEAYNSIMSRIMSLFAWLLGVAAITLDTAVLYTVVRMGAYVNDLSAIGVTWSILRDLGNIMLIFGFLAIGITTILNVNWYGGGKKMLPMLFVAAVFLNFSLFITEAVIDTGNLFATQFYTQINGGQPAGIKSFDPGSISVSNEGISNKIMSQLGLQTIYGDAITNKEIFKGANSWFIGFMGILLFLVAAFVMFSLAFILIARFVILIFLIILAPIGFVGLAVPQLAGRAKKWWDTLFEQTLTAPVLLLLLYVALAVITDDLFLKGFDISGGASAATGFWTGFVDNENLFGFASMMLSFLVAMGLLLAVTIFAKQLSAFGAGWATKTAGKLSGISLAAAAPGWVGRNTFGLAGNYAARKLRGTGFGRSFVGRGIAGTLEKRVAGASFDVRNTELGKSASRVGLDLGKGQTGGYKADLEERVKSYEAASAGIIGPKEKEEKMAAKQAEANMYGARAARDKARADFDPVAEENKRQKAEVARLDALDRANRNAGTPDLKVSQDLKDAQSKLTASDNALAALNKKVTDAQKNYIDSVKDEKTARENIGASKKQAQIEYGKRLEEVWGKIPIFGTAATAAAGRVKGSAGKTKNQLAIEAFMLKAQEAAVAGGTTIPAATPAPATIPPPTGGAPHP